MTEKKKKIAGSLKIINKEMNFYTGVTHGT